jgi:hypothetical protein
LPDRFDHFPRLIAYILSGLFDESPDIYNVCFDALEEAGLLEE